MIADSKIMQNGTQILKGSDLSVPFGQEPSHIE